MIRLAQRHAGVRELVTSPVERSAAQRLSRFVARPHSSVFWAVLGVTALCAEVAALRPVLTTGGPRGPAIVFYLVGGSFAACGLIAWRRRPDSRSGPLMTATGFAFFPPVLLAQIDAPLAITLSALLGDVWVPLFAAVMLTFLSGGRVRSRLDASLMAAFAFPTLVLEALFLQAALPRALGDPQLAVTYAGPAAPVPEDPDRNVAPIEVDGREIAALDISILAANPSPPRDDVSIGPRQPAQHEPLSPGRKRWAGRDC